MIDNSHRWYHYFMLSFPTQIGIVVAAFIVLFLQVVVYSVIQEDIAEYDGACEATPGSVLITTDDGEEVAVNKMTLKCGEDTAPFDQLASYYLYKVLTTNRKPVIVCQKIVTEYLGKVTWSCELDPKEESKQNE